MSSLIITLLSITTLLLGFLIYKEYGKPKMAFIPKSTDGKIDSDSVKNVAITKTNIILYIDGYPIQFPRSDHLLNLVKEMPTSCISDFTGMSFEEIRLFYLDVGTDEPVIVVPVGFDKSMMTDTDKWNIEDVKKKVEEYKLALKDTSIPPQSTQLKKLI